MYNSTIKRSTKRIPRVKKTTLAALKRQADRLAAAKCRARGICPSCGSKDNLQWAHVISRNYHNVRWDERNCLSLCRDCHAKFTYRPDTWIAWLLTNYHTQYLNLYKIRNEFVKIDRAFMEQTIQQLSQTRLAIP